MMMNHDKPKIALLVTLIPILTFCAPFLANMEPQLIFGMSNSFWAGFIGALSVMLMILSLVLWRASGNDSA
jgi:putative solute:sodium symporter small subunit